MPTGSEYPRPVTSARTVAPEGSLVLSSHISTPQVKGRGSVARHLGRHRPPTWVYPGRARGQFIQTRRRLLNRQAVGEQPCRGVVTHWSRRSRRRMGQMVASVPWSGSSVRLFVTLTFAERELDGRRELQAFRARLLRRWPMVKAFWWREYQRRGAVHFHLLVEIPQQYEAVFKRWLASTWPHRTDARPWQGDAKKVWLYAMKEVLARGKEYQHELPVDLPNGGGRWWGMWGCRGGWAELDLTHKEFLALRRACRAWCRANKHRELLAGHPKRRERGFSLVGPLDLLRVVVEC